MELDEIHTHIKYNKTTAGSRLVLIDLENASSILFVEKERHSNFSIFYNKLKNNDINMFYRGIWKSYKELILAETLCQNKSETFIILERHKRRTKCYSKSQKNDRIFAKIIVFEI